MIKASKELKCDNLLIITEDTEREEELEWFGIKRKVKLIPLWKWLLEKNENFYKLYCNNFSEWAHNLTHAIFKKNREILYPIYRRNRNFYQRDHIQDMLSVLIHC